MLRRLFEELRKTSPLLTGTAVAMLGVLAVSAFGIAVDPRLIGGAPAWLKPAKFGASIAIYCFTAAWVIGFLPDWRRLTRVYEWTSAVVFITEMVLILVQVVRGVGSHFNVATPVDAAIFSTMGLFIFTQWFVSIAVGVALFRQQFAEPVIGWAVRTGFAISLMGAAVGGLMTQPTAAQVQAARETHRMPVAGAHTIGGPDGGPGMPGTGWSLEHGDLRVPHFLGLHAVQFLPLVAVALAGRPAAARRRGVFVAGASYITLTAILLLQAFAGQSVAAPSGQILTLLAAWTGLTLAGMTIALSSRAWARRDMEVRML